MGRVAIITVLVGFLLAISAAFGNELGKGLERQMQDDPTKACQIVRPVSGLFAKRTVPYGAQHRKEIVWRPEAPEGFRAVLALMQVVSVAPCPLQSGQSAEIAIRAIRLIERDRDNRDTVVSEVTDFSTRGKTIFASKLYQRFPTWYPVGGQVIDPITDSLRYDGEALIVNAGLTPERIFHGWTEPQAEAKPGMRYLVEMEVNISKFARLQMGIDYWRSVGADGMDWKQDCQETNHCEGHLSDWFGPTDGWQTLRVPYAFQGK